MGQSLATDNLEVSIPLGRYRYPCPTSPAEGKTLPTVTDLGCALTGKALPEYCLSRPSRTSWRFWFNCKTQKQKAEKEWEESSDARREPGLACTDWPNTGLWQYMHSSTAILREDNPTSASTSLWGMQCYSTWAVRELLASLGMFCFPYRSSSLLPYHLGPPVHCQVPQQKQVDCLPKICVL